MTEKLHRNATTTTPTTTTTTNSNNNNSKIQHDNDESKPVKKTWSCCHSTAAGRHETMRPQFKIVATLIVFHSKKPVSSTTKDLTGTFA